MMKRILAVLDPSKASSESDRCAIRLARETGASLTGLAIADIAARVSATAPMGIGTSDLAREAREDAVVQERREAQESLATFARLCSAGGIPAADLISVEADTMEAIVSQSLDHDLVVLGEGSIPGELGSTELSVKLMKQGARPVLAVGPNRGDNTPGRVLVALDEHPQSWKSLHMFLLLFPSRLVEEVHLLSLYDGEEEGRAVLGRLERAKRLVEKHSMKAFVHSREGKPSDTVPKAAGELKIDTVVVGPYSKPSIQSLFFGSVTKALLGRPEFSVFLYH